MFANKKRTFSILLLLPVSYVFFWYCEESIESRETADKFTSVHWLLARLLSGLCRRAVWCGAQGGWIVEAPGAFTIYGMSFALNDFAKNDLIN